MTTFFKDNILFIVGSVFLIALVAGAWQLQTMQNEANTPQSVSNTVENTNDSVETVQSTAQQPTTVTPAPTSVPAVKPSVQRRRYNDDEEGYDN